MLQEVSTAGCVWWQCYLTTPRMEFHSAGGLLAEVAGAGRAGRAAEGPTALGAAGAAYAFAAAAGRRREDAQQQPGLGRVLRQIRLGQR